MTKEFFVITRLHRDDIILQDEFSGEEFTDQEMERIAGKMADDYLNQIYWSSLRIITRQIIEEREEDIDID